MEDPAASHSEVAPQQENLESGKHELGEFYDAEACLQPSDDEKTESDEPSEHVRNGVLRDPIGLMPCMQSMASSYDEDFPADTGIGKKQFMKKKGNASKRGRKEWQQKLKRAQNEVVKKLQIWASEVSILHEAPKGLNLVISEKHREEIIRNTLIACRRDSRLKTSFISSASAALDCGVIQSAASGYNNLDSCKQAQGVVDSWEKLRGQSAGVVPSVIDFSDAVEMLHDAMGAAIVDHQQEPFVEKTNGGWKVQMSCLEASAKGKKRKRLFDA